MVFNRFLTFQKIYISSVWSYVIMFFRYTIFIHYRYNRKAHKPGQLSKEEKQKRLLEMSNNAEAHEDFKYKRLKTSNNGKNSNY